MYDIIGIYIKLCCNKSIYIYMNYMYMYDIIYKTILSDFLSVCMYLHGTYSFGENMTHSTEDSPKYTMVEVGGIEFHELLGFCDF